MHNLFLLISLRLLSIKEISVVLSTLVELLISRLSYQTHIMSSACSILPQSVFANQSQSNCFSRWTPEKLELRNPKKLITINTISNLSIRDKSPLSPQEVATQSKLHSHPKNYYLQLKSLKLSSFHQIYMKNMNLNLKYITYNTKLYHIFPVWFWKSVTKN